VETFGGSALILFTFSRQLLKLGFCNGPWFVNPSFPFSEGSFRRGRCENRHLMGFEEDRSANLGRVVFAIRPTYGLTWSIVPASGPRFGRLVS
jgi:hypothetical protein